LYATNNSLNFVHVGNDIIKVCLEYYYEKVLRLQDLPNSTLTQHMKYAAKSDPTQSNPTQSNEG